MTPDPAVRARLVAQLRTRERWTPWTGALSRLLGIAESDALFALQCVEDPSAWRAALLWPAARYLQTPRLAEVGALIARMPPGTEIARHRHSQRELTYVLDGELIDDGNRSYRSGELIDMAVGTEHRVTVGGTDDCLVVLFFPRA
ncbi:MAG: cupin domain-containing protein [Polyangiales bacterium]